MDVNPIRQHVQSAKALSMQAANAGRYEDSWKIYKKSAKSVLAAVPEGGVRRHLQVALGSAAQQEDVQARALTMQRAFDELLSQPTADQPSTGRGNSDCIGMSRRDPPNVAENPPRPRSGGHRGRIGSSGNRSTLALGLSRPQTPTRRDTNPNESPGSRPGSPGSGYTDPSKGPAHLRAYLRDISQSPPSGKQPVYRSASAPHFYSEHTPHAKERYFSNWETDEGRVTSHYTKLGAPKSNSHYKNTLAGANVSFDESDRWKTSNMVFQEKANSYKVAPPERVSKDANFQYVNGDPRQGIATYERMRLPGYHRTKAEINGLAIGSR